MFFVLIILQIKPSAKLKTKLCEYIGKRKIINRRVRILVVVV